MPTLISPTQFWAIQPALSPVRLATYVRAVHGNRRRAVALYAWNASVAAGFWPLLDINEVVLRNTVSNVLTQTYGVSWPVTSAFERSLPSYERATFLRERTRIERNTRVTQKRRATTGDMIAAQTYQFWVSLLTSRHDGRLWKRHLSLAFPHMPPWATRETVRERADLIRRFRNRIAHHEPILLSATPTMHRRILELIAWTCPITAVWAQQEWPVAQVITPRP